MSGETIVKESSKMNTEEESFIKKTLDEDDQFEDFPVDTWPDSETVKAAGLTENLWEENWDDVDVDDNFTANLKEELEKHKQQQQQQQQQQ
ncbi:proteasome regulatory particle lid subunit SEM1 PWA37_001516 [Arxiozyma heterogenica]|uniref:proteasome regulatory particle lid subunit SEM1 n=1 Tax=Arxiozyma heterogenica TaxID=278026 RepID=UPI002EFC6528